jgi:predicted HTH transcriptional regulator
MIQTAEDIQSLNESIELECKEAIGRDGKGALPQKTFWETYSAFANTNGGTFLLGVKENRDHTFEVVGVLDVQKVLDELWTAVDNTQTISINLLTEQSISILEIEEKTIIRIVVPRASRQDKPVYRRGNPMEGTYQRLHSSDKKCNTEMVKRMLAEQLEDSRDDKLLEHYDINDIDGETLRAYRQIYLNRDPSQERNRYDDIEFLRSIGGWKRERTTGEEGLTLAGLLMFGKLMSIQEQYPNYMLDYQERAEDKTVQRWIDRISLDGTWSGNIFDFYQKVYRKLIADLKVPFVLKEDISENKTTVHDALREALVNTLVHADYTGKASVLVVKRPDMFGFRNPGLMRISIEQAISGYEHDCRNEKLHQMFHFIGLGERAGSGIPNIFAWWGEHHWRRPYLYEKLDPYDQTLLELRMIDLLPQDVIDRLKLSLGERFDLLDNTERLILATALTENTVSHTRLKEISQEHHYDLSQKFSRLVREGLLSSHGYGQGTVYHLANESLLTPDDIFGEKTEERSLGLGVSSGGSGVSSGGYVHDGLKYPLYDKLIKMDKSLKDELNVIAYPVQNSERYAKDKLKKIVHLLCSKKYLTLSVLVELLGRSEDYIRKDVLNPMVESRELIRAFPQTPNDPRQAYTSSIDMEGENNRCILKP